MYALHLKKSQEENVRKKEERVTRAVWNTIRIS
jgi:hypothetical protein